MALLIFLQLGLLACFSYADRTCIFEEHEQHSLYGFNNKVVLQASLEQCLLHCEEETTFECESVDYLEQSSSCYLSSESHLTQPLDFGGHFGSLYLYKLSCVIPTTPAPTPPPAPQYEIGGLLMDLGFDPGRYLNVFLDLQFQTRGEITRWQFFAKRAGLFVPTVWRPMGGDQYKLISKYPLGVYGAGLVDYFVEPGEFPGVEAGDIMGILYPNPVVDAEPQGSGIIPYESTNQGSPLCCDLTENNLSRLLNAPYADEDVEVGDTVPIYEVDVKRIPAMIATVETQPV